MVLAASPRGLPVHSSQARPSAVWLLFCAFTMLQLPEAHTGHTLISCPSVCMGPSPLTPATPHHIISHHTQVIYSSKPSSGAKPRVIFEEPNTVRTATWWCWVHEPVQGAGCMEQGRRWRRD